VVRGCGETRTPFKNDEGNAMKNNNTFKINPNEIKVRDERIKDMITANGGVARVFSDRKRQTKADKVGRKDKYKGRGWE